MYERLLDKNTVPSMQDLEQYCGKLAPYFADINTYMTSEFGTAQEIRFPYGNKYGWGVTHRKGKHLVCDVFAEADAFTVMLRMTDVQYRQIYQDLLDYSRNYIDNYYPCGSGGWIHYRVLNEDQLKDIKSMLSIKAAKP